MSAALRRNDSPRILLFLAMMGTVVAAWLWLLRGTFYRDHPAVAEIGAAIDLLIVVPLMFWLVMGRRISTIRKELAVICLLTIAFTLVIIPGAARSAAAGIWIVELVLIAGVVVRLRSAVSSSEADRSLHERIRKISRELIPFGPAADAVASEISLIAYAFSGRSAIAAGANRFRWKDTEGWNGVAIGLGVIVIAESIGIHLWLHQTRPVLAWVILAFDLYGLLWLLGDARALGATGVNVQHGSIEIDFGLRWRGTLPIRQIASMSRYSESSEPDLKLALVEPPDVVLTFRERITFRAVYGIRKRARSVGLRVEDRRELIEALVEAGAPFVEEKPDIEKRDDSEEPKPVSPAQPGEEKVMSHEQWLKTRPDYIPLEDWLASKPPWVR